MVVEHDEETPCIYVNVSFWSRTTTIMRAGYNNIIIPHQNETPIHPRTAYRCQLSELDSLEVKCFAQGRNAFFPLQESKLQSYGNKSNKLATQQHASTYFYTY